MVGGHDGDHLVGDGRDRLRLDAGQLHRQGLKPAERLGRLGELHLARFGGAHGVGVERTDLTDRARQQVGRGCGRGLDEGCGGVPGRDFSRGSGHVLGHGQDPGSFVERGEVAKALRSSGKPATSR